jgi:hypothetical protein
LAQTRTETARSGFSWNCYNRNGPKMKPLITLPLSPQSYGKSEFMGPQNRRYGKHPDAMIKDFRALLDNTQDATHRVAIYRVTREFIKH